MAEEKKITLDQLLANKGQTKVEPEEVTVADVEAKLEVLSPEDREKINQIKDNINLQDNQMLTIYGSSSQKQVAQFADKILSEVRSKDMGEVGELMSELMVKVKDMDISSIDQGGIFNKLPFVKKTKRAVESYLARYDAMQVQIDKIQAQLETARMELLKDIGTFDKLYEQNVNYFNELNLYIIAGEETIQDMRDNVLPGLFKEAEESGDAMAIQVVKDFQENINRFEKRLYDMKTSKTMAIQTAPQIKLVQNNDKLLVDKLTDAINNTIPLWKSQVVIALGINKQGQVLAMQEEVSNTTNELLLKNAERLKSTTTGVAREAERSTIDIDTLKQVNADLIETIEESLQIQTEARAARKKAEGELEQIENDLQNALLKVIA